MFTVPELMSVIYNTVSDATFRATLISILDCQSFGDLDWLEANESNPDIVGHTPVLEVRSTVAWIRQNIK